jgi:hypothetical protein
LLQITSCDGARTNLRKIDGLGIDSSETFGPKNS